MRRSASSRLATCTLVSKPEISQATVYACTCILMCTRKHATRLEMVPAVGVVQLAGYASTHTFGSLKSRLKVHMLCMKSKCSCTTVHTEVRKI